MPNKDLIKVIHPIFLMIMGALRSLFLIGSEFIIIELTVLLNWILLGAPMGCASVFKHFT